ncbi:pyridoxamine 5'-phosphate oxidase family protein [Bifidobacterium breve]|jgi:predicted pyridoxine 5'-phosphate oxidase superfamily flavin-nucleotide-binding protein|uniref:Pyridoxamine 5'-phosphate oxidase family protein n=2 Tax=Bifidobacterium breve TaxID=1685 RepID=D4BPY6_BIFBR|nr:pyridoxamine 5'-phosphate oxidase family protein [Bifidobacterium breve DSM 20213 = JCM 1192]ERI85040.1 pyridoxamine 5'-phosphate oxidase family protein [Bifidobacterium breve JCP7499]KOA40632.1 flavin-nucleotide-binding protein [Bifidobacterium breve MCC 1094]KOA61851.1 flavin-nucleotide-binding protein [Bifidobacterium breve MCC 1604]KWZ83610.1 pyridoxamine 5'-phosphate oxidase family protein [Bifidobacterium breve]
MKGFDMAVITPEIQEFIKNNLGWITTISKDGELDLGPKMSLFVLDDTHIAYHERTAGQHYENLKNGSPLVIAFANLEKKQGYRFRGNVVLHVDDDIYNEQVKVAEEKGTKKPAVIPVLEVTEIQNLASGPTAGKTIAKD